MLGTRGICLVALSAATSLSACIPVTIGGAELDAVYIQKTRNKAAFDFNCPSDQVQITKVDARTYGATGCGLRATYHPIGAYCAETRVVEERAHSTCSVASDTVFDSSASEQQARDQASRRRRRRQQQHSKP